MTLQEQLKELDANLIEADNAFMDWWQEIENFSTRGERAIDVLGDSAFAWCLAAYQCGRMAALEEAAKVAEQGDWRDGTASKSERRIAEAIRNLAKDQRGEHHKG